MDGEKKLIIQSVEKEMQRSYIDYSMSVIVGRALPDVRDGLKPVHRKILFAMDNLSLTYNRPHKKSATVVGEVLGKYHPHGDTAAYDAMVRMAQPFSLRYPLVDGQGNFGSVDGDGAAAMRYTEARMSKMASDLLADIDKETVDMVDNYDGSLKEPSVLPSKFPNLLVNGSDGIAVGMATKMPPHNLGEVCDAISFAIDRPDASLDELMAYIKGPDFPTGGTIYGIGGIRSAYETGRGRLKVRANVHVEDMGNGKERIIVDEIPYQVNKAALIEQIADRVKNKEIEGITDLRDESDRHGMRIVVELHKDALSAVVLENLFKKTNMEVTYGIINIALVDNRPSVLSLKELIFQYIAHRRNVVYRRTGYDLRQAEKRYHILEGLMKAIGMLDEAIALIRASENAEEANAGLRELLDIDEEQAKAILDMRLQKLTGLELDAIRDEHSALKLQMDDLKDILANESRVNAIIQTELREMKEAYGDERCTVIDPNPLDSDEEGLIPKQRVVITLSKDNYVKRIPLSTYRQQGRGGVGLTGMQTKEEDHVDSMFVACSHDYILFITNKGRLHWLKGYRIPEGSRQSKGKPIVNLLPDLEEDERVVSTVCTPDFPDDKYIVFCTKKGRVKKTAMSAYGNVRSKGIKAILLRADEDPDVEDDELIEAAIAGEEDDIVMASKRGKAIRFSQEEARAMGRTASGVIGMRLVGGDEVVSMAIVKSGDKLLTVTENGFGKVTDVDAYSKHHRGGQGVITIICNERNGDVLSVRRVDPGDNLMLTSRSGKIIRIEVDAIRETGRAAQGVKLMDLRDGDKAVAVQPVMADPAAAEYAETVEAISEDPGA
ncbi:MAG: DNA gyrase subunit A [Candidatus Methanomethylophilaceae archaeon]|nr:DNA gyrase subunit A [Candidatus Methanomethylophilaceae archaeon]